MLISLAAKHASHALPVKGLTRTLSSDWEVTSKSEVPRGQESWQSKQPASESRNMNSSANISKNDHAGHQGFTIVQPGMSLINIQIAPSTKPIHLGIKTVILKMTQVQFGTCCVLHPLSQVRCTSEQRQAWERPESNMACPWAEEFLFAASQRLRC